MTLRDQRKKCCPGNDQMKRRGFHNCLIGKERNFKKDPPQYIRWLKVKVGDLYFQTFKILLM